VAVPEALIDGIDRARDAIVTYMPGYDKADFVYLQQMLDWIDHVEELMCVREEKKKGK
jgi:hypothetical protein